jgi:RNA polymerase sigma-70 factor (ECF subfamily)
MYRGIFSFIYSFVPDYSVCEDLTQDAFMKIRYKANKYESGNPSAWILQIAKYTALDYIKEGKKKRTENIDCCGEAVTGDATSGLYLHELMAKTLDEEERQIVLLHVEHGYRHREIADFLDMPLGTVLWKYSRAMKTLKENIKKEE